MDDLNLDLLSGGHHRCTPEWNKAASGLDRCFKLYFPIEGSAHVVVDGHARRLEAGSAYFISGFRIDRQYCDEYMDIYWVHFVPRSLRLRYALSQIVPFYRWGAADLRDWQDVIRQIPRLFENPAAEAPPPAPSAPAALTCKIHALMLDLVGDLASGTDVEQHVAGDPVLERLGPSIDYLNENFLRAPKLAEIARRSHLAPTYFHRLFTRTFGMTPLHYVTRRRMETARQLLSTTNLTVKEIAYRVGFRSEFHFSRTFKKHMHVSPSHARTRSSGR